MVLRKALNKDIKNIAKLNIDNWKMTYQGLLSEEFLNNLSIETSIKEWNESILDHNKQIFIVEEDNTLLGYSVFTKDHTIDNCWYIETLQVNIEARRKGIGTKLIQKAGNYAYKNGYKCMSICIIQGNENARNLYTKLGAEHYMYFKDDFHGTQTNSEKLIWNNLTCFKER